jgi:hypothetical protein
VRKTSKQKTAHRARSLKSAAPGLASWAPGLASWAPGLASWAPAPEIMKRQRLIEGDSAHRKRFPLTTGLLDYFPDACAAVAEVSFKGNQKHNPGEPMHHARGKSMDHADCIMRHLTERGGFDGDIRHTAALAWRAMALLQEELEKEHGLPLPRGAKA